MPALNEFHCARVSQVDGTNVHVKLIDPDGADEDFSDPIDIEVIRHRLLNNDECKYWPGTFVGSPVAFIQPDGFDMDAWSYAIVTGYSMSGCDSRLHLRHVHGVSKLTLGQPTNVVKMEWVEHVLQVAAGTNAAALNAVELRGKLVEVRALCAKSRSGLSAKAAHELTVPFESTAQVPVIRPDTLAVVFVPRQHVLDCAMKRKAKKNASMFVAPPESSRTKPIKRKTSSRSGERRPSKRHKPSSNLSSNASDGELPMTSRLADAVLARDTIDEVRARTATTFRPTAIERQIHDTIGHPDHEGKDPQCILEYEQQARDYLRGTPPVLRGAYDFGFKVRGLSVMHFARVTRAMMLAEADLAVNMTDFSRKNCIQPANRSPSYTELTDALTNLRQFGRSFYNEETGEVLEAAVRFIGAFADGGKPDCDTIRRLVFWINTKLCKFRGLVLSEGLRAALRVKEEFSIQDPLLAELLYDQQKASMAALASKTETKVNPFVTGSSGGHDTRPSKKKGIPKAVLDSLPMQGSLSLCMKHLSKKGCSGNGVPGKCFSINRAHFRSKMLPHEAKEHIIKNFGGLAPEFADL